MDWSRRQKRVSIIAGSIIIFLIVVILSANGILSNRAESILREKISGIDTTEYLIDFRKVRVNIFTRTAKVFDISLKPTARSIDHVKLSRLAKPVFEVNAERLMIKNISIAKAIKGEAFDIGGIYIDQPKVRIYSPKPLFTKEEKETPASELSAADSNLRKILSRSSLGTLRINEGGISITDMSREQDVVNSEGINLLLEDISFADSTGGLPMQLNIEDFEFSMESHSMELPGGFYRLQTGYIDLSYQDARLVIDSFKLVPSYPKGNFGKAFGKQTDRFDLQAQQLKVSDIAFDSLMRKKVIISEIAITNLAADIFRDKRVTRDMSIFPKLFQTSVAQLPVQLYIDSISIKQSTLKYQEMVDAAEMPGYVSFDQLDVKIKGVNNDPENIRNGQSMVVRANARLMGKASIEAFFDLPIGRKDEYFTFHGRTGSFQASDLNPMTEPLAFLGFTAGTVNSVEFYGQAKHDTAVGRIAFLYQDLDIMMIKKDKLGEGQIEGNKFLSALTKSLIHKNNPLPGHPQRIGKMDFVRDPNKGFFNYYWKTIQSGLINTLLPVKKKHATDMDWATFQKDWQKVLLEDRRQLDAKESKKKNRKNK